MVAQEQGNVIQRQRRSGPLPEWAAEGAVLLMRLKSRGWLDAIADRLRIVRQGGYSGIDILVFFIGTTGRNRHGRHCL